VKFRRWLTIGLIAMLSALAIFKLVMQDIPSSSDGSVNDFVFIYLAGNAWMDGGQPYTHESVGAESVKLFGAEEGKAYQELDIFYPPTTFFALIPILLLPHQIVIPAVLLISLALYMWVVWILAMDLTGLSRYLFLAFAINYAPLHSGLRPRNVTVIMAGLILIPLLKAVHDRMSSSWWFILLGLGVAIKPQLGGAFLLILIVMGEWKRFLVAASTVAASVVISVGWLAMHGIHWVAPLLDNLGRGPAGGNSQSTLSFVYNGEANFRLINMSPLVYLFSGNYRLSSTLPVVMAVVLFLCLVMLLWRNPEFRPGSRLVWIPVFGVVGAIALLPAYSRYYGAIFILPLFAWMWMQWHRPLLRVALLVGTVLFSLPMPQFPVIWQAGVQYIQHPGMSLSKVSGSMTEHSFATMRPAFWQELICALPNLFLAAVSILLLAMIAWRRVSKEGGMEAQDLRQSEVHS